MIYEREKYNENGEIVERKYFKSFEGAIEPKSTTDGIMPTEDELRISFMNENPLSADSNYYINEIQWARNKMIGFKIHNNSNFGLKSQYRIFMLDVEGVDFSSRSSVFVMGLYLYSGADENYFSMLSAGISEEDCIDRLQKLSDDVCYIHIRKPNANAILEGYIKLRHGFDIKNYWNDDKLFIKEFPLYD
ncbi:MAG: hypothetical protein NC548_47520 [Lachnospiraceae bacterium]|nr:hypothetical protein [Lachnospiraceae bacterium]